MSNIEVGSLIQEIKDDLPADSEIYEHRNYNQFEQLKEKRDSLAEEIIGESSKCNKFVLQAGVKKSTLEFHADLKVRELSYLEKKAALTAEI
ncbi:MAG: hypothetical protein AB8U25_07165 [Rickettsiales endosymbiont of Dermacentor nuttalli]